MPKQLSPAGVPLAHLRRCHQDARFGNKSAEKALLSVAEITKDGGKCILNESGHEWWVVGIDTCESTETPPE